MKKKIRFRFNLKSKHLLVILTFVCISFLTVSFTKGVGPDSVKEAAGFVIIPFQKAIMGINTAFQRSLEASKEKRDLVLENEDLKAQVQSLTEQNNRLIQDQYELQELQALYELDQDYSDYEKVAARIISKDPGNWYDTFIINKGSKDGIRVDNNVISGKGLVGIVTEVGSHWATVKSIIDDSSHVSAMTVSTGDNCVVAGDLNLIDEGKLSFEQLYDVNNKVSVGERIVTSNISDRYMEGLFIGYVSEIKADTNNLTKTGTIVTPVDFRHLRDVFVITVNKQDMMNEN